MLLTLKCAFDLTYIAKKFPATDSYYRSGLDSQMGSLVEETLCLHGISKIALCNG